MAILWRPDRPINSSVKNKRLSQILEEKYFSGEGAENMLEVRVFDVDLGYFEGLADAGMAEAREIIDALSAHSCVVLKKVEGA
jgi:hypothetical protein